MSNKFFQTPKLSSVLTSCALACVLTLSGTLLVGCFAESREVTAPELDDTSNHTDDNHTDDLSDSYTAFEPVGTIYPDDSAAEAQQPDSVATQLDAILQLNAQEAVEVLNDFSFTSQEVCDASEYAEDYAVPGDFTYAVVTSENAPATSADVENAVWEYYEAVALSHSLPDALQLLCLARVSTQPKVEDKWGDLIHLIQVQSSVEFLLPEDVFVAGLSTGSAVAVACLPPRAYGELSADDSPISAKVTLRWAGGRWRVSFVEDRPAIACPEFLEALKTELQDEGGWILG